MAAMSCVFFSGGACLITHHNAKVHALDSEGLMRGPQATPPRSLQVLHIMVIDMEVLEDLELGGWRTSPITHAILEMEVLLNSIAPPRTQMHQPTRGCTFLACCSTPASYRWPRAPHRSTCRNTPMCMPTRALWSLS